MLQQEQLLSDIIEDTIKKGSPIIGWEYSANGKIIILKRNCVPQYCINLFQAADMLIHQYNLVKNYAHIYTHLESKPRFNPIDTVKPSPNTEESFEAKSISLCDAILFNSSQPFNTDTQNKIYNALHKANRGNPVSKDNFLLLRSRMSEYYSGKALLAANIDEKEKLRKITRFFETMKYKDFLELF
ncbi:hypothetical protein [Sulfuricurvum sp.]|uniref:hypothetical protein n=1 Tax=Sulfuricurvum sp. TaxID=2025608 RepID=UPI002E305BFE|nr:hypothetical protein [Sulfuricurvum sp.]HEX5329775.1 hypothetical protein [Sulfuricurvum sp.]